MDQKNGWRGHQKVDDSHAGSIEDHARDYGLECVEEDVDRCSSWKEAFVGMVDVQRSAKAHLPNDRCILVFVKATVVEAFRHGVPDRSVFEPLEGWDIQLDGV